MAKRRRRRSLRIPPARDPINWADAIELVGGVAIFVGGLIFLFTRT